jgi:hypothetical protein
MSSFIIFTPYITREIKSRRMGWAGHVTCLGEMRNAYQTYIRRKR